MPEEEESREAMVQRTAAWLRQRPEGEVIRWSSDHIDVDEPWSASWVDVNILQLENEAGWNWTFTVSHDGGPVEDQVWDFTYAFDLDFYGIFDPNPPHHWYVEEIVVPVGTELSTDQASRLAVALAAGPDRVQQHLGAWSAEQISRALMAWTAHHAQRPDLQFVWDPEAGPSRLLAQAQAINEEMLADDQPGYELTPGVVLSPQAFDQFMAASPEDAAVLKDAARVIAKEYGLSED